MCVRESLCANRKDRILSFEDETMDSFSERRRCSGSSWIMLYWHYISDVADEKTPRQSHFPNHSYHQTQIQLHLPEYPLMENILFNLERHAPQLFRSFLHSSDNPLFAELNGITPTNSASLIVTYLISVDRSLSFSLTGRMFGTCAVHTITMSMTSSEWISYFYQMEVLMQMLWTAIKPSYLELI